MTSRVVVVGTREQHRVALASALDVFSDIEVAATADDAASALLQAERVEAKVVLVATPFAGSLSEVCASLRGLDSKPRVLLVDGEANDERLLDAIEAGVDGYRSDTGEVEEVAESVRKVARGEAVIPSAMLGPLLRRLIQRRRDADDAAEKLVNLTRREREVLSLLAGGLDSQGIGDALVISPETARTHVQRVLRKLDVHSRKEAIAMVAQTGMADHLERMVERSAS